MNQYKNKKKIIFKHFIINKRNQLVDDFLRFEGPKVADKGRGGYEFEFRVGNSQLGKVSVCFIFPHSITWQYREENSVTNREITSFIEQLGQGLGK